MNSVAQHRKLHGTTASGAAGAVAMYFGRIAWLNVRKPKTTGEWIEMN